MSAAFVLGLRARKHSSLPIMDAILREIGLIKTCTPQVDTGVQVVYCNQFCGFSREYFRIKRWNVAEGVIAAALFSIAVSLFFGYYPGRKAAKLVPVEALRHE